MLGSVNHVCTWRKTAAVIFGTAVIAGFIPVTNVNAAGTDTVAGSSRASELAKIALGAGRAVGAASACDKGSAPRIKIITDGLSNAIRDYAKKRSDAREDASRDVGLIQDGYSQGIIAGHAAVEGHQLDCANVDRDLVEASRSVDSVLSNSAGTTVAAAAAPPAPVQPAPAAAAPVVAPPAPAAPAPAQAKTAAADMAAPKFVPLASAPAVPAVPSTPSAIVPAAAGVSAVSGVTNQEVRFGMSAPFSGPARELGRQMKLGIEAAFKSTNDAGGVNGRKLTLITADDGYEPARTADAMKDLDENNHVFGFAGNVGTPTTAVALPYALTHRMLFFGAFTGAPLLRREPPDRYVFNFRASYAEETSAVIHYLVKSKRLRPDQIVVFAQQDGYGDAGYEGVTKAMRALNPNGDAATVIRLGYPRNTVDVDPAIAQLQQIQAAPRRAANPIKAVVMVATYRAAAKFIEKTKDSIPGLTYTNVSFVGSSSLADELLVLGPRFAEGVIVTQVVPNVDGFASVVLDYKSALTKYFPGEKPDFVSLEGYLEAKVLIEALNRAGQQIDMEKLVTSLENLHDYDLGLGATINYSRSQHQALHKVWGTQIDSAGHFQDLDLD